MQKNDIILYIKPISDAYIYLYAINPKKEFRLLRPFSFKDFKKYDYFYNSVYIYLTEGDELLPESDCWEIHLIISTNRLPEVEDLISKMACLKSENTDSLTILTHNLKSEIKNLKVKKILASDPVELPEPLPLNNPFRRNDTIESWLDKNTTIINFTDIYESIYYYECKAKN